MSSATYHRRSVLIGAASIALTEGCASKPFNPNARTTAIRNARWFTGETFVARDGWSVGGRFTFREPTNVQTTLDLAGAYLVPPFADAHSHSVSGGFGLPFSHASLRNNLHDGVFYAASQGNFPLTAAERASLRLNAPGGPDVTLSNATLTGSLDPTKDALAALFQNDFIATGFWTGETLETSNSRRLIAMGSMAEFEAAWPLVQAQRNDFIKIYIWNTENAPDAGFPPYQNGNHAMPPEVVRAVVKRAHNEGLRVSAHVSTAGDVRLALDAGADMLAHTPYFGTFTGTDAKSCADAKIPIVMTMGVVEAAAPMIPSDMRELFDTLREESWRIVRLLREHGAYLVVGGDNPRDTTAFSMQELRKTGMWTDLELLRIWSMATPRAIYPERKIGELAEGFEASFLALNANPLQDWNATGKIRMRFKQGEVLALPT